MDAQIHKTSGYETTVMPGVRRAPRRRRDRESAEEFREALGESRPEEERKPATPAAGAASALRRIVRTPEADGDGDGHVDFLA